MHAVLVDLLTENREELDGLLKKMAIATPTDLSKLVDRLLRVQAVGGSTSANLQRRVMGPARAVIPPSQLDLADKLFEALERNQNESPKNQRNAPAQSCRKPEDDQKATSDQTPEDDQKATSDQSPEDDQKPTSDQTSDSEQRQQERGALHLISGVRDDVDAWVRHRFTLQMRWITIAFSIAIAFAFQVSATKLLKDLSTDPELRREAAGIVEGLDEPQAKPDFAELSAQALGSLARAVPTVRADLERVGGQAVDWDDARAEIDLVFEDHPERERVLTEYDRIVTQIESAQRAQGKELAQATLDRMALLNIEFWRSGSEFYVKKKSIQWGNIIGVLFTGILLTFGAPFWYERLRDLRVLQNALKPKEKEPTKKSEKAPAGSQGGKTAEA
jgi:hypothetical protein